MKTYQIIEISEQNNHAGTKATADVAAVAAALGFETLPVKMDTTAPGAFSKIRRQIGFFRDWRRCFCAIAPGSVVLLQHPFHYPQLTREKTLFRLKNKKQVKFICVIHDIEALRKFRDSDYYHREYRTMLALADVIVAHNEVMKDFVAASGFPKERVLSLGVFDYLQKEAAQKPLPAFSRSITVAGNLDTQKCAYIKELGSIPGVAVRLFGPNFDETMRAFDSVRYLGSFPADQIPAKLTEGFGLVWDGTSVRGCLGDSGQYLKYNNPHKLSLYLSSKMPVVIWSEAAEAAFVRENGVGVCVDSLFDLPAVFETLTEEAYNKMAKNAEALSKKLTKGDFTAEAIRKALVLLNGQKAG